MFSYCENIVAIGALIFCLKIQEVSWHQFQCNIGTSIRREVFIRKAWRLGSQFSWYDSCLSTKEMSSSNSKTLPLLGGWQGLPPGIKKIVMKKARGKHLGFNVLVNFNLGPHQQNDYCKNVMNNGMTLTWLSCRYSYPRMYIHENICVRVFAYKLCIYIYMCVLCIWINFGSFPYSTNSCYEYDTPKRKLAIPLFPWEIMHSLTPKYLPMRIQCWDEKPSPSELSPMQLLSPQAW